MSKIPRFDFPRCTKIPRCTKFPRFWDSRRPTWIHSDPKIIQNYSRVQRLIETPRSWLLSKIFKTDFFDPHPFPQNTVNFVLTPTLSKSFNCDRQDVSTPALSDIFKLCEFQAFWNLENIREIIRTSWKLIGQLWDTYGFPELFRQFSVIY